MTRNSAGIGRGEELAALADELTKLANRLCNTIPRDDWRLIVRVAAAIRNLTPAPPADLCADIAQKSADAIKGQDDGR